jgi:hypothetical protein
MRHLAFVSIMVAIPSAARADGGPLGLGLILGQPTGITGAYRVSERNTIDAAIGLDVLNNSHQLYVHADFLFVLTDLLSGETAGLKPYLGPGAYVTANGFSLGVRVPLGLSLEFHRAPLQLFLEAVPALHLIHRVNFGIGGALGFRYYF